MNCHSSICSNHLLVIRSVTCRLMSKFADDISVVKQEDARHLKRIADGCADAMPFDKGFPTAQPDLQAEDLRQRGALQIKGAIEPLLRVAELMYVLQSIPR